MDFDGFDAVGARREFPERQAEPVEPGVNMQQRRRPIGERRPDSICVTASFVKVVAKRVVGDILAVDQLAAQMQIVNSAAVILSIDDRDRRISEPRQILRAADLGQAAVLVEIILEGDRVGDLAALDQLVDCGIDALVRGVAEMLHPSRKSATRPMGGDFGRWRRAAAGTASIVGATQTRFRIALVQRSYSGTGAGLHARKIPPGLPRSCENLLGIVGKPGMQLLSVANQQLIFTLRGRRPPGARAPSQTCSHGSTGRYRRPSPVGFA